MTPPEYWLRRITIVVVCATLIVVCIYLMARVFAYFAPAP